MIPIYRAKKLDSDEYVKGFLYQDLICYIPSDGFKPDEYKKAVDTETWFIMDNLSNTSMIDTTTLSIHFPDMLDSQGNKIFASLQEDGKGGDIILEPYLETERETVLSYENYIKNINKRHHTALYSKIIGIQQ